jgi:crotonobetainyl-CoA:carnitine CoA-transferase CaiB-like acyl-CoA transferase
VRALPLVGIEGTDEPGDPPPWARAGGAARPLDGVRVLDVTRVIAGPTATKMLAAHGATVVRVEPPGFEDVPLLSVDTGFGKRRVALDLRDADDRVAFERLVRDADVVVSGFRPGALAGLGYDDAALRALQPSLVTASLSAWGTTGPWAPRRGFDSLVQMASGIAAAGMDAAHADRPVPLPCQFLDHGSAYLLAFGVLRALDRQARGAGSATVRVALARTAAWLIDLGPVDALGVALPDDATVDRYRTTLPSTWGDLRHVRPPGSIDGAAPHWDTAPQPAASATPEW